MSRGLQKLDFADGWKGLFKRRQDVDVEHLYAETALNVELYGSMLGKRPGSQYVTGWGTRALAGWTLVGSTATGLVTNAGGFNVGDQVTITDGTLAGSVLSTITAIVGATVTLSPITFAPQEGMALVVRRPLQDGQRVDGIFQATYRNGQQQLLAACGTGLFRVEQSPAASVALPELFPKTMIQTTVDASTLILDNVQTVRAELPAGAGNGEHVRIPTAGTGGDPYEGRVITVDFTTRTITLAPPMPTLPAPGDEVFFFPLRQPGDTHFVQHANLTHIASENTPPVKYDGTNVYRHGVLPPIAAPVDTAPATTSQPGTYGYRYKFLNAATGQESEPSPALSGTTGTRLLELTNSIDPQVTHIRIYRTVNGGDGAWYFVAEIPQVPGLTTPYDDVSTDLLLGVLMREFLDVVAPDGVQTESMVSILALWAGANRLVGIDRVVGAVIFSDQPDLETGFLKPEGWPPDNQIFVNYDDGDKPIAVVPFFDALLVSKGRSVFRILGLPPELEVEPLLYRQDLSSVGAFNQKAIIVDQNEMLLPGFDGWYLISRYQGVQQGFESSRISRAIDDEFDRITPGRQRAVHGVFYRRRRQLRAWVPVDGEQEPNLGYVFQFEGTSGGEPHGWTHWSVPRLPDGLLLGTFILDVSHLDVDTIGVNGATTPSDWPIGYTASCIGHFDAAVDRTFVGTRDGCVLMLDEGFAEAGAFDYDFEWTTVWFCLAGKGFPARTRALLLLADPQTSSTVSVTLGTSFAGGRMVTYPVAPGGGFQLDVSQLDVGRLGGGRFHQSHRGVVLSLGEYQQLTFRERSATAAFRLLNWTLFFQGLTPAARQQTVVQAL